MKAIALILAAWTAHPIIPFGPLSPCNACTPVPGHVTISWDTPVDERTQQPFTIDHYVVVYEDTSLFSVQFLILPADASSYTLTGLTSGDPYAVWLEAHGTDGFTNAVTPLMRVVAP